MLDSCTQNPVTTVPPMQNAGEPSAPLTTNLTVKGFITAANGWTEAAVFDFNPWDTTKDFAGAGNVADDLVDGSFLTPACAAP